MIRNNYKEPVIKIRYLPLAEDILRQLRLVYLRKSGDYNDETQFKKKNVCLIKLFYLFLVALEIIGFQN